jgi:hypothetical protein
MRIADMLSEIKAELIKCKDNNTNTIVFTVDVIEWLITELESKDKQILEIRNCSSCKFKERFIYNEPCVKCRKYSHWQWEGERDG